MGWVGEGRGLRCNAEETGAGAVHDDGGPWQVAPWAVFESGSARHGDANCDERYCYYGMKLMKKLFTVARGVESSVVLKSWLEVVTALGVIV
jgi:hypothetical protein